MKKNQPNFSTKIYQEIHNSIIPSISTKEAKQYNLNNLDDRLENDSRILEENGQQILKFVQKRKPANRYDFR